MASKWWIPYTLSPLQLHFEYHPQSRFTVHRVHTSSVHLHIVALYSNLIIQSITSLICHSIFRPFHRFNELHCYLQSQDGPITHFHSDHHLTTCHPLKALNGPSPSIPRRSSDSNSHSNSYSNSYSNSDSNSYSNSDSDSVPIPMDDHNALILSVLPDAVESNLNSTILIDFDFLDSSNLSLIVIGSLCTLSWTIFYILFHIALLQHSTIYYTKTCVFSLWLSSMANVELSLALKDPFAFIPNAISVILTLVQFTKYAYDLRFDFSARSWSKCIRFEKRRESLLDRNEFSNTMFAKYNDASLPNRRKRILYEEQERMRSNMSITFDNTQWMHPQTPTHSLRTDHLFDPNDNEVNEPEVPDPSRVSTKRYKSRVNEQFIGHGKEKVFIKVESLMRRGHDVTSHAVKVQVAE